MHYFEHEVIRGKGSVLHNGNRKATGGIIVIHATDLEYAPQEYNLLLRAILEGHTGDVCSSRFVGSNLRFILFFWHCIGNKFLTFLNKMMTNLNLRDMEMCYKMFRAEIIKNLKFQEKRFRFEPEVTSKNARIPIIRI